MVLEVRALSSAAAAVQAAAESPAPVLYLAEPEHLPSLVPLPPQLPRLRERDDLVLRRDPPLLLWHRARRLVARAAAARAAHAAPDELTGLPGRKQFLERLSQRCLGARRGPLSLLTLDLDHFKRINDRHGHAAGDKILRELAARLAPLVPSGSELSRVGGEDFSLLSEGRKDEALALAERLRVAVREQPFRLEEAAETVTISVGVATLEGEGEPELLLRAAQEAMMAAKARGRDRVVHLEQLEREALERDVPIQAAKLEDLTRVITERVAAVLTHHGRKLFQEIREQAELDGLTGLYSRRYFDLRLRAEFDAARDAGRALTVALLDVDHFGAVNKTHGWPVGDQVLVELSSRVAQGVRAEDWVARYGGEEFALVLHGLDSSRAALVLERIRAALSASPVLVRGGQTLAVTASIGAATLRPEDDDPAALMERVSERLLAAKRSGRDRVCVVA